MGIKQGILTTALVITAGTLSPSVAAVAMEGALAVKGTGEPSYLAVRVEVPAGKAIGGVTWVHNDETSHVTVRLAPAGMDGVPVLSGASADLPAPSWASVDWVGADLGTAIRTEAGNLYVVFEYPTFNNLTGQGYGTGAGVGFVYGADTQGILISVDGTTWSPLHSSIVPLVDVELVDAAGSSMLGLPSKAALLRDEASSNEVKAAGVPVLGRARPNPFNPSTSLVFQLPEPSRISLVIYDVRGRQVRQLRSGHYPAGEYRVVWDGTTDAGERVANGVYFARLTPAASRVERLVLVK